MKLAERVLVRDVSFPDSFGVYVVYERESDEVPLYVGKARTQTLRRRWVGQHLYRRSGGSALRRSLGVDLGLTQQKLMRPHRFYPKHVEEAITRFLDSCYVEVYPTSTGDEASELEARLIKELHPRLNIRGR